MELLYGLTISLLSVQNNEKQNLEMIFYSYIHCSIIHSSQEMETTMSIGGWVNKNKVYTYNGLLFSFKKERNPLCHMLQHEGIFEDIMISKISQYQKTKYYMISLGWGT